MTWRSVAWDNPALALRGAIDVRRTAIGIRPHRLPAWSDAQMPDPADKKPAGWDDIPAEIPDPDASKVRL
jgi:hypothetical protein